MGVAEIDDAKAATTARTITEEKRIVCEGVIWNQINLKGFKKNISAGISLLTSCQSNVQALKVC